MNILYIGDSSEGATSLFRANALSRLGHVVNIKDPYLALSLNLKKGTLARLNYHTGYRFLQFFYLRWIREILINSKCEFDLIWIDNGEFFGRKVLQYLSSFNKKVVLFNHDDPTGPRDKRRFYSLIRALPYYSLVTAVRDKSEQELRSICGDRIVRIWMSYDEEIHKYNQKYYDESFESDVCFVGTWMRNERRDEFILELLRSNINVAIWGDRWNLSPNWKYIAPHWRGPSLRGAEYVSALHNAKICIGLLSKGNRDLHTTRSMEIPYAGGLLCAERTTEHLSLYLEDVEAVFWSDIQECIQKCKALLSDEAKREFIRKNGHQRVLKNGVGNEAICGKILSALNL